ncbi:hypothetical protein HYDPIDRAFT_153816 [Hydnomerulius pinastri MD-312]|uniref:AB hydrolase-1 domain-containing protein n=1 Tax=Hydnomerulius pinastri MD-312 TaxID=994086 RepID=A0A0C9W1V1_9AGAM|nr:hypothetical protein HYDPIDRAFT_153816 [Hydnomerulius pinastri MD-312]
MSEEGLINFPFGGKVYQTWYKLVGKLGSGERPLVVLHGGPGLSHHYMLPHLNLHAKNNIPVIIYDQIGIGQSTHLPDAPKEFWTVELFMDELDNVLSHFGIKKDFDLLGHSWGGMLAAHYVSHRHPEGLNRLVLASAAPSMSLWLKSTDGLREMLPEGRRELLKKLESEGRYHEKAFEDAMMEFYKLHVCRLNDWPKELTDSFDYMNKDPTVYSTMVGPSEFTVIGTLKDWSCLDQIHTITCPTLLTNGVNDEAQNVCVSPFFEKLPKVQWRTFPNSSHMAFFEEPDEYFKVVGDFLRPGSA